MSDAGAPGPGPFRDDQVRVVPANEASADDLDRVFGSSYPARCRCQRFKVTGWVWRDRTLAERVQMQYDQTRCGDPDAPVTSGLVAYVDGEPAGWVAVEPRTEYPKLLHGGSRVPWSGRAERKDDDTVWAVTCFSVRKGFRGRGLMYVLAAAAAEHAFARGARAVEAYPMITRPGEEVTWGEVYVGARQVFEEAGFREVSHPTLRRVVMRREAGDPAVPPA